MDGIYVAWYEMAPQAMHQEILCCSPGILFLTYHCVMMHI